MISMKMSAIWEAEKSSSCSIRRLCHIQIGQMILYGPIDLGENSSNGVYVALRMQGNARRVLRSPEVSMVVPKLPPFSATAANLAARDVSGYIPIDINCTIQYSHVLKMDSNILQILLQKRKKYKNTTMNLGYKTLAYCSINLSQVLQRRIEHRFLNMYPDPKCHEPAIARIEVHCLATLPWERDLINPGSKGEVESDGCLEDGCLLPVDVFSDDPDEDLDSDEEVDMEDVETSRCGPVGGISSISTANVDRGGHKKALKPSSVGHIKQKVISLLKRIKLADPNEEIDTGTTLNFWEEIDKIEAVSDVDEDLDLDAGGTADSGSLQSVARPSIRPFFGHAGSSEETLSLDAGARLLRRLQKEALLAPSKHVPSAAVTTGLLNGSSAVTERELKRQSNATASGGRAGVKFPPRFGPIKTRCTVPTTKRSQFALSPPMAPASPAAATAVPFQEPLIVSDQNQGGSRSYMRNLTTLNHTATTDIEPIDCEAQSRQEGTSRLFVPSEVSAFSESLADVQFVVNTLEPGGRAAAAALAHAGCAKLARVSSFQEVRQVLSSLVSLAQMHHEGGGEREIRFCVVGGDALLNAVLRAFVEVAGARSEIVAAAFRFFIVPITGLFPSLPSRQQPQIYLDSRYRRSSSSTFPSLLPPLSGSPSISRESHSAPVLPPLSNLIAQRLCALDPRYACLFSSLAAGEGLSEVDASTTVHDRPISVEGSSAANQFVSSVVAYLSTAQCLLPLPIGECLVAGVRNNLPSVAGGVGAENLSATAAASCSIFNPPLPRGSSSIDCGGSLEEESGKQTLVPFLLCIRLGSETVLRSCLGHGSTEQRTATLHHPLDLAVGGGDHHPPGAPHLILCSPSSSSSVSPLVSGFDKPTYELQLEYWALNAPSWSSATGGVSGGGGSSSGAGCGGASSSIHSVSLEDRSVGGIANSGGGSCADGKGALRPVTFKAICRSVLVGLTSSPLCLSIPVSQKPSAFLNLAMITREKKPKIMRIGKKTSKEVAFKPDLIEGVTQLICTCKSVVSYGSGTVEPTDASLNLSAASRCADVAPLPPTQPLPSSPHVSAVTASTDSTTSRRMSSLVRDDLACGVIVSGHSTSSSSDPVFVRISIDGVDWQTSRFFQVAPGWRTHVKVFPLVCMSPLPTGLAFALPLSKVMVGPSGHSPPPLPSPHPATVFASSSLTQAPATPPT